MQQQQQQQQQQPLTAAEVQEKKKLVERYRAFFEKKQLEYAPRNATCDDVLPLLERAADIAVRLRARLQLLPPDATTPAEGHADEALWDLVGGPAPLCAPREFVRRLVRATLIGAPDDAVDAGIAAALDGAEAAPRRDALGALALAAERVQRAATELCVRESAAVDKAVVETLRAQLESVGDQLQALLKRPTPSPSPEAAATTAMPMEWKEEKLPPTPTATTTTPEETASHAMEVSEAEKSPAATEEHPSSPAMEVSEATPATVVPPAAAPAEKASEEEQAQPLPTGEEAEQQQKPAEEGQLRRMDSSVIKIGKIGEAVEELRPKIAEFERDQRLLDLSSLSSDPIDGLAKVEKMQRRSRELSEYLMQHLLTLDSFVGEKVRPLRKAQVSEVQQLMDAMERNAERLRAIRGQLEKEAAAARAKQEEAEKEAAAARAKQEQEAKLAQRREALETLRWSDLKLKPKLHVQEQRNAYVISGSIPGMSTDAIKIDLTRDGRGLMITGVREPTAQEVEQMVRIVEGPRAPPALRGLDMHAALMQLASGRYGKFAEEYELPDDAIVDSIQASYEAGVLRVVIPRSAPRYPRYRDPFFGGAGFGGPAAPPAGGFWGDDQMWW